MYAGGSVGGAVALAAAAKPEDLYEATGGSELRVHPGLLHAGEMFNDPKHGPELPAELDAFPQKI
uniref:hypothetical protein n=1 Tax=Herbidospora sakaeratensis TaxID=564415 RepID=UPI000785141F|nr:hypothetical protein [Herbidospora sakaeratensis]